MMDNEDTTTLRRSMQQEDSAPAQQEVQAVPPQGEQSATVHDGQPLPAQDSPDSSVPVAPASSMSDVPQAAAPQVQDTTAAPQEQEARTIQVPAMNQPEPREVSQPLAQVTGPAASPYMTVEDLLALRIVGDPQVSPNGEFTAYCVLSSQAESNTTSSSIWLVENRGGKAAALRQISSGEHRDTMPRWSPDGGALAFLSDRTGTAQLYLLPFNGGEARQISHLTQGVTEYSWRPDGTLILAHSAWKPADEQETPDLSATAVIYTRLDQQVDEQGFKYGRHQQLWLLGLDGSATRLTSEPVDLLQSCWSPDGTEIAFCANRRPDPDLSLSMAVWVLTVATGQLRRLTPLEGWAQMPSWSPDGRTIAYLYTEDQTETTNIVPYLVAAQGGNDAVPAVADMGELTCQAWIIDELHSDYLTRPQWYADGKALLIIGQKRGQVHLYRVDLAQKQVVQLTGGNGRYFSPHLNAASNSVSMIRADWFTPGDVWSMESDGKNLRKLTGVNDSFLRSHQLIRPRRITWKGNDGLTIEGWLYLPPLTSGTKAPLIVTPHGGPTLAWGDSYVHEFQVLAGRGFAVLAPNPRGSAGYGEAFSKEILNNWGGDDLQDVLDGLDHVIATEPVDEQRLGISGMSYGGYMTNWAITQTTRFKAAVSRNGVSFLPNTALLSDRGTWFNASLSDQELLRTRSALPLADRITAPLLLLHAENDLACPFSEALQLFTALRRRKHIVQLVRYPNASHLMDWPQTGKPLQRIDRLRRTVEWFEHFL